ncbi:MAG: 30S ribosomal protein S2 [Planctomycetes bacterium]|nr:30S ribosomal protein S2 [Planctomycetota bacterium]
MPEAKIFGPKTGTRPTERRAPLPETPSRTCSKALSDLSVQEFVDAGAHIGCRVSRWNPKMDPFIFGSRNRIHIIDLRLTIRGILRARHFLREVVASGQDVLFVGTKPQIRPETRRANEVTGMHYVDDRWIGGTLTNYEVIGSRIGYLDELEKKESEGYLDQLNSKEEARFFREKRKIWRNLHGIRDMFRLPGALVVVDPKTEANAVREARRMGIPVVGIVDTDGDPDVCDIVIPANDDAIRSVALVLGKLSEAVVEGKRLREERGVKAPQRDDQQASGAPVPRPGGGGARRRPAARQFPGGLNRQVEIMKAVDGEKKAAAAKAEAGAPAPSEPSAAAVETPAAATPVETPAAAAPVEPASDAPSSDAPAGDGERS